MSLLSKLRAIRKRIGGRSKPDADILRESGLFDTEHYLATYPEAADSGLSPIDDYLKTGVAAGRDPNTVFQTAWYLQRYPDVHRAGVNPLVHFIRSGAAEGRDPGPDFETRYYLRANPDVAASGMNPLVHYLRNGRAEGRTPREGERGPMDDYEDALRNRRSLVGAATMDHVHFPLHGPTGVLDPEGRPLPPIALAKRIGAVTLGDFDVVGRGTRQTILRCLPQDFDFDGARILDFGCGVGRVLRHFSEEARRAEFWGCDIDGPSIRWCVENLSPPFRFFQISEIPTIPLESNSFDLVYAISVFAHIHADWHHWMAEVRRILKPGGYAFITFMAQTPHEEMLGESYGDRGPDFGKYVKNPFADWNEGGPMAFHNPAWIKAFWGNLFDIEFIALEGLLEYQSICLMRKPRPGAPIKTDVPVLKYSASQAFDPDAVGWIHETPDPARGFRESYGVEVRGAAAIGGWIVFRGDRPARLDVMVDGIGLDAHFEFGAGALYRDWANSYHTAFTARFDASALPPGEHKLDILVFSQGGKSHALSIPLIVA